ncbi:MAG TPA: hypothetical protein VMG30_07930 [Acidobacteriota bacterium]|nr:hypothetical protein [Acidobacteriota bacterium]
MARPCLMLLAFLFGPVVLGFGTQSSKPSEESGEFRWLNTFGDTEGIHFSTRQVQPLSLQNYSGPPVNIEREETRPDPRTTRITSRTFSVTINGERRLIETVVEEIKRASGGTGSAVRTTSRPDASGRMRVASREIQEAVASGTDSFQISKTLLLPGMDGTLVEKERIQQLEQRKGNSLVEIDRTRYELDFDGKWNAIDRRVSQNHLRNDRVQTEEQVYRYDANRQLSLTQQIKTSEWKDPSGQRRLQTETCVVDLDGKLRLDTRVTLVQKNLDNQRQETTEVIETANPAAAGEELVPMRKIVEYSKPLNLKQTEKTLEVLKPSLNGSMESIYSQKTIATK